MKSLTRSLPLRLFFLLITSLPLLAQPAQPEQQSAELPDRGYYTYIGIGGGHDPLARYTGELDINVGYDFGRTLEIETGMPFFFLSATDRLDANGTSHFSNRFSSFGDTFVRAKITPAIEALDYTATMTVTAPTGSRNVTTGQATWDCTNRVEVDWWRLRPIGEFALGNVPPVTPRLDEPFKISGFASQFRLGNSFSLTKAVSFDASFYESFPIGNSSVVATEGSTTLSSSLGSNLLADHGFTGSFSKSTTGRVDFDVTYNYSIAHSLNAISFTIGYRIGHVRKDYD
jgi:hypothetical protein